MTPTEQLQHLNYEVDRLEKRVAAVEGRDATFILRLNHVEDKATKTHRLVSEVLAYVQTLQDEFQRSLTAIEANTAAAKAVMFQMAERQGKLIRDVIELQEGEP